MLSSAVILRGDPESERLTDDEKLSEGEIVNDLDPRECVGFSESLIDADVVGGERDCEGFVTEDETSDDRVVLADEETCEVSEDVIEIEAEFGDSVHCEEGLFVTERPSLDQERDGVSEMLGVLVKDFSNDGEFLVEDGDRTEKLNFDVKLFEDDGNPTDGDTVLEEVPRETEVLKVEDRLGLRSVCVSTFEKECDAEFAGFDSEMVRDLECDFVKEPRVPLILSDPVRLGLRSVWVGPSVKECEAEFPGFDSEIVREIECDFVAEPRVVLMLSDPVRLGVRNVWVGSSVKECEVDGRSWDTEVL